MPNVPSSLEVSKRSRLAERERRRATMEQFIVCVSLIPSLMFTYTNTASVNAASYNMWWQLVASVAWIACHTSIAMIVKLSISIIVTLIIEYLPISKINFRPFISRLCLRLWPIFLFWFWVCVEAISYSRSLLTVHRGSGGVEVIFS